MILVNIKGIYCNLGVVELETNKVINWASFSDDSPPEIPFGSSVDISISFHENDFLTGKSGVVWATYDLRQAEVIQGALLAQQINSEIKKTSLGIKSIFILIIKTESDIDDAIDFIWKNNNGLRLKPDWNYQDGEINKSFEQWLSGQ
ncbi:MAG: hypothetical protein IT276_04590 [Ignavibacteriaceae bacterium]|nr:hypothetical protein [Ignavibacterium sp.]MCC6254167.1 hypothetical protein [Ignavibacteriaceae bacterium]HMN23000.1 hypothetical protein [Ignavibacteriaceae bacterium]HRN25863.1 hypothetical protein [Ignavibacteriaceae bacterium]HRP92335.1 hypothetical protein [Ignavibacteriaceae bacterium]